jgi:transcriptional regulator with XRE-family HTH domain
VPIIRTVQTLAREDGLTAMSEGWTAYVRRVTEGLPRRDIAAAAGIHVSGVSRWLSGESQPSAEKVISFARGLHQSPIQALVAAGYLEPTDVNGPVSDCPIVEGPFRRRTDRRAIRTADRSAS